MLATPTTTITILRGTTTNQWGDEIDTDTPHQTGIPASLLEQNQTVMEADATTPMTVRIVTGRVGAGTDITEGDRIKDEQSGVIYNLRSLTSNANPLAQTDIRLNLDRVD